MRKLSRLVAVVAAMMLATGMASAAINVGGSITGAVTGHLYDASNLYFHAENGGSPMAPRPIVTPPLPPAIGDENRTIFSMDQFVPGGADLSGDPTVELTGLFYNLTLVAENISGTNLVLYFAQSTRNPLTAGSDLDGDIAGIAFGGVVEVYEQHPDNLDLSGGPGAWVEGQTTASRDSYPTASDGTLWLSGVLVEYAAWSAEALTATIPSAPGTAIVYRETINFAAFTGHAEGYINVFGGSAAGIIGRGTYNTVGRTGADIQLQSDMDFAGAAPGQNAYGTRLDPAWGYQVESNDPVRFQVTGVPEPTIMLLFGASIVGGLVRRRRGL